MSQNYLESLSNYPFQQLRELIANIKQDTSKTIALHIGTPQKQMPLKAKEIINSSDAWNKYPNPKDEKIFCETIYSYLTKRFKDSKNIKNFNSSCILPSLGSREALFGACYYLQFLQETKKQYVVIPNPSYQIYQGSAVLNGYTPYFYNVKESENYAINPCNISEEVLKNTAGIYLCNPSNPQGACYNLSYQKQMLELAKKYNIMLIVDECYIDVYLKNKTIGTLDAIASLDETYLENVIVTNTLSKRSNAAGLRSGFLFSSNNNMQKIAKIRTYTGSLMTKAILDASLYLWSDEAHVQETRAYYKTNLEIANEIFANYKGYKSHDAGFFVWLKVKKPLELVKKLYKDHNILTLPGSYLCNEVNGKNPGDDYIRLALVFDSKTIKQSLTTILEVITLNDFKAD